jgi:xanthine dehydrogenase accessory factor
MHNAFLAKAQEFRDSNTPYATAYIVRRKIPSSGKPGDKAIITRDGDIHGWIGGGCTRGIVLKEALAALQENKPRFVSISPEQKENSFGDTKIYKMTCQSGGEVEIYIEPVIPKPRIMIFGASHIAMALGKITKSMDYQLTAVMTDRDASLFPGADQIQQLDEVVPEEIPENTYIVVCTQGEQDLQAIHKAINANPRYLAFVSSRKKANSIYTDLRDLGINFSQLSKIKTPAGIDIGAKTPEEVAISILAEIIQDYRSEEPPVEAAQKETKIAMPEDFYINPVCQVPVQKSTAKHVLEYEGEKVYFCCDGCKVSFEKEPEKYMAEV